jgi:hypothetical protein
MSDGYDRLIESTEKLDEWLAQIAKMLAEALQPDSKLRRFVDAWPQIETRMKSMGNAVREAFARAEVPPCRLLSIENWEEIETAYQGTGADEAATVATRLSCEALKDEATRNQMMAEWRGNPVVAKRADIVEQAMTAHAHGWYALSVPPLLAQLEGIVADGKHIGERAARRFSQDSIKEYVRELAVADDLMGEFIVHFVSNIVLANFYRGDVLPEFSRHAILHGADVEYGNEVNSAKAILVFDYVQHLLGEESRKRSGADCDLDADA